MAEIIALCIALALLAVFFQLTKRGSQVPPACNPAPTPEEIEEIHRRGEGYGPEQLKLRLQLSGIGPQPIFRAGGLAGGPCLEPGEVPAILSPGLDLHLNPASQLPPVDCPLLISVQGQLLRASRPTFAERKGDDLEYELTGGGMITGRFPWTYQ